MPDVIAALEAAGIDHRETSRGWVETPCPLCGSKDNGGINLESGQWNCWSCGANSIRKVLRLLTGSDETYSTYWTRNSFTRRKTKERIERKDGVKMPGGPLQEYHVAYLRKRGFDPNEIVRLYHVRGTDHLTEYKFRLMIPILVKGRVVSFQGRDITERSEIRYKTCPKTEEAIPIKSTLYGEWLVPGDTVVVCEGVMDAWKLGPGAVALYGLAYTPAQVKLLGKYRKVVLVFDDEEKARQVSGELEMDLGVLGVDVESRVFRGYKDPGEVPLEKAQDFMAGILRG